MLRRMARPTVLEICAGGGGQAAGLEAAGFDHAAAVEIEPPACATLRHNRPLWHVIEGDVRDLQGRDFSGVDLLAGGVPCPPFSIAGKQLGADDERDLFPTALELVRTAKPRAVLLENVPGFASSRFDDYRNNMLRTLRTMGYEPDWRILNARDFGVAQLRPRFVLVALREPYAAGFSWPTPSTTVVSVGDALRDLMGARGWRGVDRWAEEARGGGAHAGGWLEEARRGPTLGRHGRAPSGLRWVSTVWALPTWRRAPKRLTIIGPSSRCPWWRDCRDFTTTGTLWGERLRPIGRWATPFRHPSRTPWGVRLRPRCRGLVHVWPLGVVRFSPHSSPDDP
jgi:site-specific DNA-cytosine methylase